MKAFLAALLAGLAWLSAGFAAETAPDRPTLLPLLSFEGESAPGWPAGWGGGPRGAVVLDRDVVHGGKAAARLERVPDPKMDFTTLTLAIPVTFAGQRLELRGFIKTEAVTEFAGLWVREEGSDGVLEFDNMAQRAPHGTTDWTEYSVSLPLNPAARKIFFGVLLRGAGCAWADDLQLLVDGQAPWDAPRNTPPPTTVLDTDTEFVAGSGFALREPTPDQVAALALLGRVWGFLKYHHPAVTSGRFHWDFELFRELPKVAAATDAAGVRAELCAWIDRLGPVAPTEHPPAGANVHLAADTGWFRNRAALGEALAGRLEAIHAARPVADAQFYVSFVRNIRNPQFDHEPGYPKVALPDPGYQLLALFRYWNIIQYWFPYRDLLDEPWDAVLADSIPAFCRATGREDYQRALLHLIVRARDTHSNLWSAPGLRPPGGSCRLPVHLDCVEGRAVVTQVDPADAHPLLQVGDVIESFDGRSTTDLVAAHLPSFAGSNRAAQLRDLMKHLVRGPAGPVRLGLLRDGARLEVTATRVASEQAPRFGQFHDRPGPAFQRLDGDIAYLKFSAVKAGEVAAYLAQAEGTKGWVLDLRNYPSAFLVFALGNHLVPAPTPFVRFTAGRAADPGSFAMAPPLSLKPEAPRYAGRIVILVDAVTQSSAEYHAMAFRAAPGAIVVGSTTAGADGNVSQIPLPGGESTMISGLGVFYPDQRPTQRVGIVPDVVVERTVRGVREGRDEVLEAAIRLIRESPPTTPAPSATASAASGPTPPR